MDTDKKFYNKNERLTLYALACGYVERNANARMYAQHGVIIVQRESNDDMRYTPGEILYSGTHLSQARKALDAAK